ncbi:MAG: ribosome alternative rescue factor ArfA [Pseudomonas stutzeri]|nr:ribosome alternative rescue factor ArfA [Stutzerimonas stutzeri]
MAKSQKRSNKAKSLVAQPLFRSRQEQPKKGKGSYRREASQADHWEASLLLAA